ALAMPAAEPAKTRDFTFRYVATVTGLKPGQTARLWLPVPPSDEDQDVRIIRRDLPAEGKIDKEPKYGNQILYLEAAAGDDGKVTAAITYNVKRREVTRGSSDKVSDMERELFLKADKLVPVGGKPLKLLEGKMLPD